VNRQEMHKKVIAHCGFDVQFEKAVEEIKELLEVTEPGVIVGRGEILTEMADVKNCAEQMFLILQVLQEFYDISDTEIEQEQEFKMNRTMNRIGMTNQVCGVDGCSLNLEVE
jgi:hypothetical protein